VCRRFLPFPRLPLHSFEPLLPSLCPTCFPFFPAGAPLFSSSLELFLSFLLLFGLAFWGPPFFSRLFFCSPLFFFFRVSFHFPPRTPNCTLVRGELVCFLFSLFLTRLSSCRVLFCVCRSFLRFLSSVRVFPASFPPPPPFIGHGFCFLLFLSWRVSVGLLSLSFLNKKNLLSSLHKGVCPL